MKSNCMWLPAKTLAIREYGMSSPGEEGSKKEKEVTPEAGDPVDFSVRGVVKSVKNGQIEVEARFVNGTKIDFPKTDADEEAELKAEAEAMDKEAGYVPDESEM